MSLKAETKRRKYMRKNAGEFNPPEVKTIVLIVRAIKWKGIIFLYKERVRIMMASMAISCGVRYMYGEIEKIYAREVEMKK